jgi:hypothetical protein
VLKRTQYWVLSAVGAGCVLLVLVNMVRYTGNQGLQARVNARAQYIQQTAQLQGLYQQIVHAVADLSVRNKDVQLRQVLARQGIHVVVHPQAGAAPGSTLAEPAPAQRHRAGGKRNE